MRSYEVLRTAADRIGVKALAAALKLSPALVYKWCQEFDEDDSEASGARNPLDRTADIVRLTGDREVVQWLCHEAGGFFVKNPPTPPPETVGRQLVVETQELVEEFSRLLTTVTKSIADDGEIETHEAERIRHTWERFKSTVEEFTVACEQGVYRKKK